jgi:hypothetical protein
MRFLAGRKAGHIERVNGGARDSSSSSNGSSISRGAMSFLVPQDEVMSRNVHTHQRGTDSRAYFGSSPSAELDIAIDAYDTSISKLIKISGSL